MAGTTRKLIVCSVGIFVCYFYFGILQEKITRSTYGENERYTCTLSLVFFQCVVSAIFAKIMLHTLMKEGPDATRQVYYGSAAFSYIGGMVTSNMALQFVNYPTQVVGKSCKPIPVMLMGVLIAKKRYSLAKYFFVFMIVLGVSIFIYKEKPAAVTKVDDNAPLLGMGEILLLLSLGLDGFTGAIQDRMRREHHLMPNSMMFYMNLWASCYLALAVIVTGELWLFIAFIQKYPYVIRNILMFSLMSVVGQFFIYLTVVEFGPLPCSIITTTRKFFTVLGSVLIFGNSLLPRQWIGVALVFTGLTLDSIYGKKGAQKKTEDDEMGKEKTQ